jgi:hypothetical protein
MTSLSDKIKKQKLIISFLLIIMIFVSSGIFTINGLHKLGLLTRRIYEHPLVVSNASLHAALDITKMHRSMKDVVLANSTNEIEASLKDVKENEQEVYGHLDIIKKDILGEEGKALEKQTRELFVNWNPIREEVVLLLKAGNTQDAISITKAKGADHVANLEDKMLELTSYARNKADNFIYQAESKQSYFEKITSILTISGVLVSIIIAFLATRIVLKAERLLQDKNNNLQKALDEIKTLRGILPICSFCKNIRNDQGYYERIEDYIYKHSGVDFSHTICPSCMKKEYPEEYKRIALKKSSQKKQ